MTSDELCEAIDALCPDPREMAGKFSEPWHAYVDGFDAARVAARNLVASTTPDRESALAALRDYARERHDETDRLIQNEPCETAEYEGARDAYADMVERLEAAALGALEAEPGAVERGPLDAAYQEVTLSAMDLLGALDMYGPTYVERMPPNLRTAVGELRKAVTAADELMPEIDPGEGEPPHEQD